MIQNITEKISKLLLKHGIQPRQQKNIIAEILGMEYISIHQKFSGKRAWSAEQLKTIANHFNEPVNSLTDELPILRWNAILKIDDIPQRCLMQHGEELVSAEFENLVAACEDECWFVVPGTKIRAGEKCFRVAKLEILPQPRVAALDDNPDITETITAIFGWHGVEVQQFQQIKPMIEMINENTFDGYILDWMLSNAETAEAVIKYIREELGSEAPITILTGELRTKDVNQSDIARMVERYDVVVHEKPAILELLVKPFSKMFFSSPSVASA